MYDKRAAFYLWIHCERTATGAILQRLTVNKSHKTYKIYEVAVKRRGECDSKNWFSQLKIVIFHVEFTLNVFLNFSCCFINHLVKLLFGILTWNFAIETGAVPFKVRSFINTFPCVKGKKQKKNKNNDT